MEEHKKYMHRCIELARNGLGTVAPNPMVGCVIVHQDRIIGEGLHQTYGKEHAEVNAINRVVNKQLLKEATLYVNLEPCSHFGKTPPCANLIVEHKIPYVVIGCKDPSSKVAGKGIALLEKEGCKVTVGVLQEESEDLNKRFFTFHTKKRPYIILKWAETKDGYISKQTKIVTKKAEPDWISNEYLTILVHRWRSEEPSIMVGTNTALKDNPRLNLRKWEGKNPLRIVIDKSLRLPSDLHLFDQSIPTIVFTLMKKKSIKNLEYVQLKSHDDKKKENLSFFQQALQELHKREVQSIIVEGGRQLLTTFIKNNLWDEARRIKGNKFFGKGVKAPVIPIEELESTRIEDDYLLYYRNP